MESKLSTFIKLANIYQEHGYHLYLVGGSVRDYLLNLSLTDMDVVTDATPEQEKEFLDNADYTFSKYGSVKLIFQNVKFDITTLRKEEKYLDSRHPALVEYTKELKEDVSRRDITINALYLTKDLKVIDFVDGIKDLDNKVIKVVGDPDIRFKEDPLRIIRVLRFKLDLNFEIEPNTLISLKKNAHLIKLLNKDKVTQEVKKCHNPDKLLSLLNEF